MGGLLRLVGVSKGFLRGRSMLPVLVDVSLEVAPGEIVAVVGSRFEGKTTLLKLAAGMLPPDDGEVWFEDVKMAGRSEEERSRLLGHEIAWTHREGTGLRFDVLDYVGLPLMMGRRCGRREVPGLARRALERVGAGSCAGERWEDLRTWERVQVALAQSIVGEPRLLVVDDLLDGLGMRMTRQAGDLLRSLVEELGCGALMTATELEAAAAAGRILTLGRGTLKVLSDQTTGGADIIEFPNGARRARGSRGAGTGA
jgi:predicted ABC-type transport system involved in lysophospholipase L1 biosynthesis ATPase subunit